MVSKARDDLPDPDKPVITISLSLGRSRSTPVRLWARAPLITILLLPMAFHTRSLLNKNIAINKKIIFPSHPPIIGDNLPDEPSVVPISIIKKKTSTMPKVMLKEMTSAFLKDMLPRERPIIIIKKYVTEFASFR